MIINRAMVIFKHSGKLLAVPSIILVTILAAVFLMGTAYMGGGKQNTPQPVSAAQPASPVLHPVIRPEPQPLQIHPVVVYQTESRALLLNNPWFIPPLLSFIETSALREITAYNAGDLTQCEGDPCISGSGENICLALEKGEKRCAANFVPFGTKLWVEGVGECIVADRMHKRFTNRVDIAMPLKKKKQALAFGRQTRAVKTFSSM